MFTVEYTLTNAKKFIEDIAASVQGEAVNNEVVIPEKYASGYFKAITLGNGLEIILTNLTINADVIFRRKKSDNNLYTMRMEEFDLKKEFTVKIGDNSFVQPAQKRAGLILSSCNYDFEYLAKTGTAVKSIYIILSGTWLSGYLKQGSAENMLNKYLSLKAQSFNEAPFDTEYREYFNRIFSVDTGNPMHETVIENRVMLILEKFLSAVYKKSLEIKPDSDVAISAGDMQRLMHTEAVLVHDFNKPAPTIQELSRIAAMSPTSLKKKFKMVYGCAIYEYFQKNRMAKAKLLLLSGEYTIKEIGIMLGYQNLSNFSTAFKKEFNLLPSQLE